MKHKRNMTTEFKKQQAQTKTILKTKNKEQGNTEHKNKLQRTNTRSTSTAKNKGNRTSSINTTKEVIKQAPQQRTRTHDTHQNVGQRTRANTMSKTNDSEQKRL